jgi:hypothetical protein
VRGVIPQRHFDKPTASLLQVDCIQAGFHCLVFSNEVWVHSVAQSSCA